MGMADNIFICSNYAISLALFDQIEKSISLLEDKYNDPSVKNDKEGVYKYRVFATMQFWILCKIKIKKEH